MGITSNDIAAQRAMLERGEEKRKADWKQADRERLRDTFAAAALTGLLASMQKNAFAEEMASHAYELADAMIRERERTNHDAAPEACVQQSTREPERSLLAQSESVERGLPRTGNTPALGESEREAIEQVLDELSGRACAESWVPEILRNLLERLK
jgi:hypothetical protein